MGGTSFWQDVQVMCAIGLVNGDQDLSHLVNGN